MPDAVEIKVKIAELIIGAMTGPSAVIPEKAWIDAIIAQSEASDTDHKGEKRMICIDGLVTKSADELCDTCKTDPCPTAEMLLAQWNKEQNSCRPRRMISLVISDCQLYTELLP